jgi:DNA-directed RNA polymerase subunit L
MGKPVHINSLAKYVKFLQECEEENILFRGQRKEDHTLRPKIARITPKEEDVLDAEYAMLADFKREAIPYLQIVPQNDWEWLAVAQHHGMATRMLD